MDDLQLVSILEMDVLPARSRNNLQVQFNSDAVRLHTQMLDQGSEREAIRKVALVAVDLEFHDWINTFLFAAVVVNGQYLTNAGSSSG